MCESFGGYQVVHGIDLTVDREVVVVIGPSGSGTSPLGRRILRTWRFSPDLFSVSFRSREVRLMGGRARMRPWWRLGRWGAVVLAVVAVVSVAVAGPAAALPPGGGGGGGGGPDCRRVSASLSLSATNVFANQSVTARWTTSRPVGCGGTSRLVGPGASGVPISTGAGSETFVPPLGASTQGVITYAVVMTIPGSVATTGWTTVTVAHGPPVNIEHTPADSCFTASDARALGAPMILVPCDGNADQAFQFWPVAGIANTFYVTTSNGLCLAPNPDAQMLVTQYTCPASANVAFMWTAGEFAGFPGVHLIRNYAFGDCMSSVGNVPWADIFGAGTAFVYGLGSLTVGILLQECNPLNVGENWTQVNRT